MPEVRLAPYCGCVACLAYTFNPDALPTSPPSPDFPELPLSTNRAAGTQYLAIGAAYAVAVG